MHTADIFGAGFLTYENCFFFLCSKRLCLSSGKTDFSGGSARDCGNSADKQGGFQIRLLIVNGRIEDTFNIARLNTHNRFFFGDKSFIYHIDGHSERSGRRTLTGTALEHIEFTFFYGELHILHIFVVVFQKSADFAELIIGFFIFFFKLGEFNRRTDTRNDVFTLRIKEVIAVEYVFTAIGIARKADAGTGGIPFVTEYHLHNVDCSTLNPDEIFYAAIGNGFFSHPRIEYRSDSTPKLFDRILREVFFNFFFIQCLKFCDNFCKLIFIYIGIADFLTRCNVQASAGMLFFYLIKKVIELYAIDAHCR